MIKAVFFDVDHTLFSHTLKKVPESALSALSELQNRGIKIFLATGRALVELNDLHMENIPFDGYVLTTGQLCLDKDHNIIAETPMDPEDMKVLAEIFHDKKETVIFVEKDRFYVNVVTDVFRNYQAMLSSTIPPVEEYYGDPVYQVCFIGTRDVIDAYLPRCRHVKATNWNYDSVDLVSSEGGKAMGIGKMMEYHGLHEDEVMAFGDSENDIDMLHMAGVSVCMGNGAEEVRRISDYVTADIDDDGIYKALKHFELI